MPRARVPLEISEAWKSPIHPLSPIGRINREALDWAAAEYISPFLAMYVEVYVQWK